MIVVATQPAPPPAQPALDPVQVQALLDRLTKLQSTAGSVLSGATQAKKLLLQMTTPPPREASK